MQGREGLGAVVQTHLAVDGGGCGGDVCVIDVRVVGGGSIGFLFQWFFSYLKCKSTQ